MSTHPSYIAHLPTLEYCPLTSPVSTAHLTALSQVRVIRQLLEAHVTHLRAVSEHSTTECGCDMMLENLCHSLSHYHVRKLESQLQVRYCNIRKLESQLQVYPAHE